VIVFKQKGNLKKTSEFMVRSLKMKPKEILEKYALEGTKALASATPIDSGETARAWGYEITEGKGSYTISWTNSNIVDGVSIAILIQYGHGTRNGGYVKGRDYINPALKSIFNDLANDAWKEITRL